MRLLPILLLLITTSTYADEHAAASDGAHAAAPTYTHPDLPASDRVWPPAVLGFIGAMFVSAACVGAYVHMEDPSDLPPPAHSHDEPPGASGHHGPGGTMQPDPEHDTHGHGHH